MRVALICGYFLICLGDLRASAITLTPGSLLVQQASITNLGTGTILSYTKTGSISGTAATSGFFDLPENITVLNGNLYVSDGAGMVNRVDLATGAVISSFRAAMFGLNGLGSLNGNLLTLKFSETAVGVYSIAGILQQSITLASLPSSLNWNGIASDGTTLFLAEYTSGRLYEYSKQGALLGFIQTNAANGLTGVSYDASNNSLWIANSVANQVEDLDLSGAVLSQFSTGGFRPFSGIAVVPVAVPEPAGSALLMTALGLFFVFAQRLRSLKFANGQL